ncbi:MAG: hypothetical protein ABDH28_06710 [Brevinematia bacterium]
MLRSSTNTLRNLAKAGQKRLEVKINLDELSKLILILFGVMFFLGCPQPKKVATPTPVKNKDVIVENSSWIVEVGPIPEWVLYTESPRELQKSGDRVFFVVFVESEKREDIDPYGEFSSYLSHYLPDAPKLVGILKLSKSSKYWQKLKNGKYQNFFKYEITKESILEALKRKNEFSEKTRIFLDKLQ